MVPKSLSLFPWFYRNIYFKEKSFLKQLVCEKKSKKICFPTDNYDSLFTLKNIFNSLHAAHPTCGPNPCQEGASMFMISVFSMPYRKDEHYEPNCPIVLIDLSTKTNIEVSGWLYMTKMQINHACCMFFCKDRS